MSDELDDLFRQQLGSHATPPDAALAQRLAELAAAERLDARFRAGLGAHMSAPRRELWERLEDEHLRPVTRRRPAAAWWQLAVAALVLLGLLVGGGLWLGGSGRRTTDELAGQPALTQPNGTGATGANGPARAPGAARKDAASPGATSAVAATAGSPKAPALPLPLVAGQPARSNRTSSSIASSKAGRFSEKNNVFFIPQATDRRGAPSSRSVATAGRAPRRTAPTGPTRERLPTTTQQRLGPDAAPARLAKAGGQPAPASNSSTGKRPVESTPSTPSPVAPVLAATAPAPDVIEVEVRRGPDPTRPPADRPAPAALVAVAASATPAPRRPRLRLGNLLREAGHLARGEQVSLAEATGLPESLTLRASLGGRSVSKTIEL